MTPSVKVEDRYYVDFDDGTSMRVNTALIAQYSLFTGRKFEDEEFEELRKNAELVSARARAFRILGTRNMSKKEVEKRLIRLGESEQVALETGQWLEDTGVVNDKEYAAMVVRHYAAKGWGMAKIKSEFVRRGIPGELWQEALEQMPETESAIDRLLEAKLQGAERDENSGKLDRKDVKRACDYLMRRGFNWDEIKSALRRYEERNEE